MSELLSPQENLIYSTYELIHALRVAPATFYKYKARLGLVPRKKRGTNKRFYTYDEAMTLLDSIYPPIKRFYRFFGNDGESWV